jgi:DNA-binding MarR family transcriptional regulator
MRREADDHARQVLDAIRQIVRAIRISSRDTERAVGLSAAQLFVLSKLHAGRAMSINEVAERTLTHQSSVSVVVSKLEKRGLVQRTTSSSDRRRQELSLTGSGRATLMKAPTAAQDQLVNGLQEMAAGDVRQLAELLNQLVESVGLSDGAPPPLMDESLRATRGRRKIQRVAK